MGKVKKVWWFLGIVMLFPVLVLGQDIPARPDPPRLVNDFAGILDNNQIESLEKKLVAFNDSTSTQLVVVIVKTLNGYDKHEFARQIGEQWGVGQKGKNNGAVLLVKPKYPGEKGEASIQTGYGLEGAIPDALAKRIVDTEMLPKFREGNYYTGIDLATSTMISLAKGEFTADQYTKRLNKKTAGRYGLLVPLVILAIVLLFIRGSRSGNMSVGKNLPFWTALFLLGSMGRGHSGSWNNFTSGGGGFGGGGGGGGFGGFGGGSFGGGGAGGSW